MKSLNKISFFTTILLGMVVFLFVNEPAYAIKTIRDGGATEANGYRASPNQGGKTYARDVDPSVKRAYEGKQIQREQRANGR